MNCAGLNWRWPDLIGLMKCGALQAHMSSTTSENKAAAIAAMIPVLIREDVSGLVDYSFLENGNSILIECRRVLANSYVFAFFTFGNEMFAEVRRPPACSPVERKCS